MPTLLKEMVLQALDNAGGVDYLRRMAEKQPAAFLGLLGKILPTQLTGEGGGPVEIAALTPEERRARARATIDEAFAPPAVPPLVWSSLVPGGAMRQALP